MSAASVSEPPPERRPAIDAIRLLNSTEANVARRLHTTDWSKHPLGPVESWPQSLRTMVRVMLASRFQMWLGWGEELFFFYNDAYAPTLGLKEPRAFGSPFGELWPEIAEALRPRIEAVTKDGKTTWDEALLLFLERNGYPEETYHTFSYSPIPDDRGKIGGLFCTVTEVTDRVIAERRMAFLRELSAGLAATRRESEVFDVVERCAGERSQDLPFALFYLFDADGKHAVLARAHGTKPGSALAPSTIPLDGESVWPAREISMAPRNVEVPNLAQLFGDLPQGPWSKPPRDGIVVPIAQQGQSHPAGFVVVGINPFRPFDAAYEGFLQLLAGQVAAGIASTRAYEAERKRAEALAEIDRAKTTFFSNVSHELRTPLTLMLGPLEEIASHSGDNGRATSRELATVAHRNGLRLLKLVNTLLDFSRIEAGRMQASFVPTELGALTADIASTFRSAIEKAGLKFTVECPQLSEPIYVDGDLWEKIVLNLLSNAYKFTLRGEIKVSLHEQADGVQLTVQDTGVGIPEHAQARLFERFYRIEGTIGRTQEGTGIGLALVHDLVKLHGGSVRAVSTPGEGSTFIVTLSRGRAHLPPERVTNGRERALNAASVRPFVEEALRWTAVDTTPASRASKTDEATASRALAPVGRVLLVDDNADMREYVQRLLSEHFDVSTAPDGEAALEALESVQPGLILSDVMMPRLDGFGLVRAIRSHPKWHTLPIILLSARAGEEARVEGIGRGADDYLVKPFSAREVIARVRTHLDLARTRKDAHARIREAEERLRLAMEAGDMGTWALDVGTKRVEWSDRARSLLGLDDSGLTDGWTAFLERVHPEDRTKAADDLRQTIERGLPHRSELRVVRPDGQLRWICTQGKLFHDDDGRAARVLGAWIDITERRTREQKLRDTRARLNATLNAAAVGTWTWDMASNQLYGDASVFRLFSFPHPEEEMAPLDALLPRIHPDDLPRIQESLARALGGETQAFEEDYRVVQPDGSYRWIASRGRFRAEESEQRPVMSGVLMDITARKQEEEALRRREELTSTIIDRSPFGIFLLDADLTIQHVNPRALPVFAEVGDFLGRDLRELVRARRTPEAAAEVIAQFERTLATGESFHAPKPSFRQFADGSEHYFDWEIHRVPLQDGKAGLACYFLDVTAHILAQQRIQESTDRLEVALAAAKLGLWSWDAATDLVDFPDRAAEIFGIPRGRTMTWTAMQGLLEPSDAKSAKTAVEHAVASRTDYDIEYRVNRPDGTQVHVAAMGRPIFSEEGKITGMIGVVQDITGRKRTEEERAALLVQEREAREEAQALSDSARALSSDLDLHNTVQKTTDVATKLTGAKFGAFFYNLVNERQESYVLYTLSGAPREAFDKFGLPRNTAVFAPTFKGEGVVRLHDVRADPRYGKNAPHHGMPKGHLPVRSYLAVPVISRNGEVLGGMFFGHPEPGVFTARSERVAVGIASQAAIAIDNAKLYQRVQTTVDRLNFSLSSLQLGDWRWDAETDIMTLSPRTIEIYGFPPDTRDKREALRAAIHPEDRERARAAAKLSFETASDYDIEYRVVHPKRGVRWVAAKGRPVFDANKKVTGMMGVVQDITERKQAELHLRSQRDVLEQIVAGVGLAEVLESLTHWVEEFAERKLIATILLISEDGRHLRSGAGKSAPEEWTRYVDGLEIGPSIGSCGTAAHTRQVVVAADIATDPRWAAFKDEALRHGLRACWSTPIAASDGSILGTFAIYYSEATDPTPHEREIVEVVTRTASIAIERKCAEDALKQSRARLQEHAELLERTVEERTAKLRETIGELEAFSYSISHDMRAPLRSMYGYAELVIKDYAPKLDSDGVQYLRRISKNAARLELLVRDVLAYSKVAKEDVQLTRVDLDVFVPWLIGQMPEVQRPEVTVTINGPLPAVLAHEAYLSQIFTNLIGNSLKFARPGVPPRIEIASLIDNGLARLTVTDNGIGIDPAHFNRIFEIFGRVYPDKKYEGTGIGLSIVKKAVHRMGGAIGVDSTLGNGTTFWFTLRFA